MRKKLNRMDILSLALGSIIGWGAFTLPGSKFLPESGIISTAIGFVLGGLAIVFIQEGYHIMMEQHHEDGGEFSYAYKYLGRAHGFIVGWSLTICYISMIPLNATAFVLVLKKLFGTKMDVIYLYSVAGESVYLSNIFFADFIILLFAYINMKGVKPSSRIQNSMILLMVINIIFLSLTIYIKIGPDFLMDTYIDSYRFNILEVAKVFAIVPFLFVGFDIIPQVSTELSFKSSKATGIAIIAISMAVLLYNLLNIIPGLVYTPKRAVMEEWALGSAVLGNIGFFGFLLLIVSLFGAISGGINGFLLGSSKLIGSLSSYQLIPEKYNMKNKNEVFENGVKFVALVSLIAPFFGREVILYIVELSSLFAAIAYVYVCYIGFKISKGVKHLLSAVGTFVSFLFILLLMIPGSPAKLSKPSMVIMILWMAVGYYYYNKDSRFKIR